MSKVFDFYLRFAIEAIKTFQNRKNDYLPLILFLKEYFKKFPKAGSRDRKTISQLVFNFYRTGNLFVNLPIEQQIILSNFICEKQSSPILAYHLHKINPSLIEYIKTNLSEKINYLNSYGFNLSITDIFPFSEFLSDLKNLELFLESFTQKPCAFIRVRKGKEEDVSLDLNSNKISFNIDPQLPQCFIIKDNAPLTNLITFSKGFFEIQDRSSQQVLNNIEVADDSFWWDACCASGGKTLLLLEQNKNVRIFATDIRQSIIDNFRKRISKVGFGNHETQVWDLTQPLNSHYTFDGIICDVPCSGSGTWARTPEQLKIFNPEQINNYAQLQEKIVQNCLPRLRKGGQFIYITCSVFKQENEEMVQKIISKNNLKLLEQRLIEGSVHQADSMFVARFIAL